MEKQKNINLLSEYFRYKKRIYKIYISQIEEFYRLKEEYVGEAKYNIGDDVIIDSSILIHGTRISINELENISINGLIAPEFLGKYNKKKKKPFVVEFWNVQEKLTLKEYLDKYCGVTIDVKGNSGNIIKRIITSMNNIEKEILELKEYRDYIIYQNQEQRFLPNKYNNNAAMAFIVSENSYIEKYLSNDIFNINFDKKTLKQILPKWFYKKYMLTRNFDNYETGREKAILFGVPSNFIEGILVNKEIENDENNLKKIKDVFPKCYICNIDGKVIK